MTKGLEQGGLPNRRSAFQKPGFMKKLMLDPSHVRCASFTDHSDSRRDFHTPGHGFAMGQDAIAERPLEGMADRVAVIKDGPKPDLLGVLRDNRRFDRDCARDGVLQTRR
jgi:hypothetical protein